MAERTLLRETLDKIEFPPPDKQTESSEISVKTKDFVGKERKEKSNKALMIDVNSLIRNFGNHSMKGICQKQCHGADNFLKPLKWKVRNEMLKSSGTRLSTRRHLRNNGSPAKIPGFNQLGGIFTNAPSIRTERTSTTMSPPLSHTATGAPRVQYSSARRNSQKKPIPWYTALIRACIDETGDVKTADTRKFQEALAELQQNILKPQLDTIYEEIGHLVEKSDLQVKNLEENCIKKGCYLADTESNSSEERRTVEQLSIIFEIGQREVGASTGEDRLVEGSQSRESLHTCLESQAEDVDATFKTQHNGQNEKTDKEMDVLEKSFTDPKATPKANSLDPFETSFSNSCDGKVRVNETSYEPLNKKDKCVDEDGINVYNLLMQVANEMEQSDTPKKAKEGADDALVNERCTDILKDIPKSLDEDGICDFKTSLGETIEDQPNNSSTISGIKNKDSCSATTQRSKATLNLTEIKEYPVNHFKPARMIHSEMLYKAREHNRGRLLEYKKGSLSETSICTRQEPSWNTRNIPKLLYNASVASLVVSLGYFLSITSLNGAL